MFLRRMSGCLSIKKIWNEVEPQLFEKLTAEPIKGRYVHDKLKMWKERIKTNFHDQDVPYNIYCPVCMTCLDEHRKQQAIDKKVYCQKLMDDTLRRLAWHEFQKNIVMHGNTMIDRRTGEVLDPEVDSTC